MRAPGSYASVPSARPPTSRTQQASSRATATLATQGRLPAAPRDSCLRRRRAVASSQRRFTAAGTAEPAGGALGFGEHDLECRAASTGARLEAEFPVSVMPPSASFSPLECSGGARPSREAQAPAAGNLEKRPASVAGQNAVTASMPLMRESASVSVGRY